ncbi:vWA domain-containing protein [Taibaiella koreensis]|uniref:vWA domain-containing protein n=1 Tax=Taibaiella koreensis TaxID=1268548 RepID=UPI000E59CB48|nr:VWA domain-containing protein [Taibaiella koreensis]
MSFLNRYHILFAHPWFLLLLLLLPLLLWYFFYQDKRRAVVFRISSTEGLRHIRASWKARWRPLLHVLRSIAFVAFVIALARPQKTNVSETIDSEGIDIVLSMDISGSMLAEDFKPDRLEAAKDNALKFIDARPTDRIGLVIFSGESFTQCPITIDHNVLKEQLSQIKSGMLQDGTAIGDGLATAVDRLRDAKGKSRVVILMTDGVNNVGKVGPELALEIAKAYKVRVYTIGVGTEGEALSPVQTPYGIRKQMVPVQIDEELLKKIAKETGGNYYRATGNSRLENIYKEIDKLEKTSVEVNAYKHYGELFFWFAFTGVIALVAELALSLTVFRRLP